MKRMSRIITMALLVLGVAACEKDINPENGNQQQGGNAEPQKTALKVSAVVNAPKVTFDYDITGNTMALAWELSDPIFGFWKDSQGALKTVSYKVDSIDEESGKALFIKTAGEEPGNGTEVYMYYAPDKSASDISADGSLAVDLKSQAGTTDIIKNNAYMCASATVNGNSLSLKFNNQFSIVSVKEVSGLVAGKSYTITLSAESGLASEGSIQLIEGAFTFVPEEDAAKSVSVSCTADESGKISALMVVPGAALTGVRLDGNDGLKVFDKKYKAITLVNGQCHAIPAIKVRPVLPVLLPGKFTVNEQGKKVGFIRGNLFFDGKDWDIEEDQYFYRTIAEHQKYDENGYKSGGTGEGNFGIFIFSTDEPVLHDSNDGKYRYGVVDGMLAFDGNGSKLYSREPYDSKTGYRYQFVDWSANISDKYGSEWYTLSTDEWEYLMNRKDSKGKSKTQCVKFKVDDSYYACGVLLFDDSQEVPADIVDQVWLSKNYHEISLEDYDEYVEEGAVFLPATGAYPYIGGTVKATFDNSYITYWTSNVSKNDYVLYADAVMRSIEYSYSGKTYVKYGKRPRDMGAVRLALPIAQDSN